MRRQTTTPVVLCLLAFLFGVARPAGAQTTVAGERLDPATYGPSCVETMFAVLMRDRFEPRPLPSDRLGQPGEWVVPPRGAISNPRSGSKYIINKWGDTRMGITFPQVVDVQGAWFAGQAARGTWAAGVRAVGYRDGVEVQRTAWFRGLGDRPRRFEMDLHGIDRLIIEAEPVIDGAGWYALDDLTYTDAGGVVITLDFEDLAYRTSLTGTSYGGLTWELGTGETRTQEGVHAPLAPPAPAPETRGTAEPSGTRATAPFLHRSFQGVIRGDAGSMGYPPDSIGAVGPQHYVETVNRNFAVYDKVTGAQLANVLLGSFLPGSNGDPRILYDQFSNRWVIIVTDFNATASIFLAVSTSSDPLGPWFKTSFVTAQGSDVGAWPDYPTLGVDQHGIYTSAYMIGNNNTATVFAIDKAPLIADPPSLGTITAFRQLPFEGATQPAHTFGTADGEYFVSLGPDTNALHMRRVNPPLAAPTLTDLGVFTVPGWTVPPSAPALGSTAPLNTVGDRLMMAVYRDGAVWTAHTVDVGGRAACRWYQLSTAPPGVIQTGVVADPVLHYYFPSIMVNQDGDAAMGFTGSSADLYAGCYYTGRRASDPAGEMAVPVLYKAGTGPQNNYDGFARNRWGDYSYTTLDPLDQSTFWTIQEYGHDFDVWGTWIAVLSMAAPDCNSNGVPDDQDIAGGTSQDCNGNGVPDECEADCNSNGVPDDCDVTAGTSLDCNGNGLPDECDITSGTSADCQANGVPDECEVGTTPITIMWNMDADPGWTTDGLWAWGQPQGGGGAHGYPDPTSGYTGPNVYGYNLAGDYENGLLEQHLTTPALDCSRLRNVRLSYWRWLGVEEPRYDHAYVRVSNNGVNWTVLWQNTTEIADNAWVYQEFDISTVADGQPTVYLRWTMGMTDYAWRYCGWNLDDISLDADRVGGGAGDANANAIPDECETVCRGDCNCDGTINWRDIDYFVAAMNDNQAAWTALFAPGVPSCLFASNDVNGDGGVNWRDIDALVAAMNTACP